MTVFIFRHLAYPLTSRLKSSAFWDIWPNNYKNEKGRNLMIDLTFCKNGLNILKEENAFYQYRYYLTQSCLSFVSKRNKQLFTNKNGGIFNKNAAEIIIKFKYFSNLFSFKDTMIDGL